MKGRVDFQGLGMRNVLEAELMNQESTIVPCVGVVGESDLGLTSSFLAWEAGR